MSRGGRVSRASRTALGSTLRLLDRGTPRLRRAYARLDASAGLGPGDSPRDHERRLARYLRELTHVTAALPYRPTFTVLVFDGPESDAAVRSARMQAYPAVQILTVPALDLGSDALDLIEGDLVTVLPHDARLYPHALAEVVRCLNTESDPAAVTALYGDHRWIDPEGNPVSDPVHKPAWSPLLALTGPYFGHSWFLAPSVLRKVGDQPAAGSVNGYDLFLRATEAGARAPVAVPHLTHQFRESGPDAADVVAVVGAALAQRGIPARAVAGGDPGVVRLRFPVPDPAPVVAVVIPTRDRGELLAACLDSVLGSSYPALRVVVVDNGSIEARALSVLDRAGADPRVTVLHRPGAFNFASLCNAGVAAAHDAGFVCLLNNDTRVITADWLEQLVGVAALPGVGAVGAQLRYPDGSLQHAGLIGLGSQGFGHALVARDPREQPPLHLGSRMREVIALTGACLLLARAHYLALGGLDEHLLPNDSGDVDLCLRVREQLGASCVYVPEAVLSHAESATRTPSFLSFERHHLATKWPDAVVNDPYLNPNLARNTRMEPDAERPAADLPGPLFARWLAQVGTEAQPWDQV